MQYKFAKGARDYSDFASGRVFYSLPGHPAFPIRLASEIFQRCVAHREAIYHRSERCVLYDPLCGAGYQLSVLACYHRERVREVIGSDVDEKAVALAQRNLGLLDAKGLDRRIAEISSMIELYGKESHKEALKSAQSLRYTRIALSQQYPLETRVFPANATQSEEIHRFLPPGSVDIVFSDVPYGQHSHWHASHAGKAEDPLWALLEGLVRILSTSSVLALVSTKQQKVSHERYQRIEQFQVGKRRVSILRPG